MGDDNAIRFREELERACQTDQEVREFVNGLIQSISHENVRNKIPNPSQSMLIVPVALLLRRWVKDQIGTSDLDFDRKKHQLIRSLVEKDGMDEASATVLVEPSLKEIEKRKNIAAIFSKLLQIEDKKESIS